MIWIVFIIWGIDFDLLGREFGRVLEWLWCCLDEFLKLFGRCLGHVLKAFYSVLVLWGGFRVFGAILVYFEAVWSYLKALGLVWYHGRLWGYFIVVSGFYSRYGTQQTLKSIFSLYTHAFIG
jgi:hypothetical protein